MPIDWTSAAVAGVVAAQVMETPAYPEAAMGLPLSQDVFAEGVLLLGAPSRGRRVLGWVGHAALAGLISFAYAAFFRAVGDEHLLAWGAVRGVVHFTAGGLVVAAVFPMVDRDAVITGVRHPGLPYRHYGSRDVTTFLVGHVVFGCLVGLLYPLLHPALYAAPSCEDRLRSCHQ